MITRERKIVEKLCWCSQDGEPIVASGASLYEQGYVHHSVIAISVPNYAKLVRERSKR